MVRDNLRFALGCGIALLAAAAVLVVAYRQTVLGHITESAESRNVALASSFARVAWPYLSPRLTSPSAAGGDASWPERTTRTLRKILRVLTPQPDLLRITVHTLDGHTVFPSRETSGDGNVRKAPGFVAAARGGRPASELMHVDSFRGLTGELENRDLVRSFVPLRHDDGPVRGVLALYSDVTPLTAGAGRPAVMFLAVLVLASGALCAALFLSRRRTGQETGGAHPAAGKAEGDPEPGIMEVTDALHGVNERFAALATTIPGVVYQRVVRPDGDIRYTYISEGAKDLFGVPAERIIADPKALFDCHSPEYRATFRERLLAASRDLTMWDVEASIITPDGQHKYTHAIARPRRQPDGSVVWDGIILDTTRIRHAESMVQRLGRILDESSNEIYVFNAETLRLVQVNRAVRENLRFSAEELREMTPMDIMPEIDSDSITNLLDPLRSGEQHEILFETVHRRKDNTLYPVEVRLQLSRVETPPVFVAVAQDITTRKQAEEQIRRQANFDALTALPNRTLFFDRLSRAITAARRRGGLCALLFIDLDRFKVINDNLGHIVGDRLLQMVAERLKACVRKVDTVARFGGDEFTVVLPEISRGRDAAIIAQKVTETLSEPFYLDDQEAFVGASIGITLFPTDAHDEVSLLRKADMAMYQAKEEGRDVYRFFSSEMHDQALERMKLENDLRHSLEREEFVVHYQPIIDLRSGQVAGAEALLRWQHPDRGLVFPDIFIPVAEETGLIAPIGEWVLRTACAHARAWQEEGGHPVLKVAVNLSSRQIQRGLSPEHVGRILADAGVAPHLVSFEITESLTMQDTDKAVAWLRAVKAIGVGLSVDDFGTGYSSLEYLKRFPIDIVKIDRSFVRDVTIDPDDAALVAAIIALARSLDLKVVAEGIETAEQLAFFEDLECDFGQGFHLGKPMPAEEFKRFARHFGKAAAAE